MAVGVWGSYRGTKGSGLGYERAVEVRGMQEQKGLVGGGVGAYRDP